MLFRFRLFLVAFFMVGTALVDASGQSSSVTTYRDFIAAVKDCTLDSSSARSVESVMIDDGPISIVLEQGSVVFYKSLAGRRIAAYFKGSGTLTFTPSIAAERIQLKRFYPSDVYSEGISEGLILFGDTAASAYFDGQPVAMPSGFSKAGSALSDFLLEYDNQYVDEAVSRVVLNGMTSPLLMVRFKGTGQYDAIAYRNDFEEEPYALVIGKSAPHKDLSDRMIPVVSCPTSADPVAVSDDGRDPGDLVFFEQHTITSTFTVLDMATVDAVDLTVLADSVQWFTVYHNPKLAWDSITMDGQRLQIYEAKDGGLTWIRLPFALEKGRKARLLFTMHGRVVERYHNYTVLDQSITWYPAHNYSQKAFFDITFNHEERYTLISIGKLASRTTKNGTVSTRWISGKPMRNASFHIGVFKNQEISTEAGMPSVTMHYITRDQADVVAMDVKQSLTFYSKLFGNLDIEHLYATELPGTHGEAFPGLVHLSSYAFVKSTHDLSTDDFFGEQFTAHEVGHQWWGIGVDFATYRDQWLSESFAEYSCLMYSQLAAKEGTKFFRLLEEYRDKLFKRAVLNPNETDGPPSMALGRRVRIAGGREDYNLYVYYKGAWVLHMLRNLLLDLNTMNEDTFMAIMRDFYTTYKGKKPSTRDFQAIVEKHVQRDMTWFFDQWVVDNRMPTYTVAWKKERQADGKWKVTCRVKQAGVPPTFAMSVPLKITTDANVYRMRLTMTGESAEVALPLFPEEPDDLLFNDLQSVLCVVKKESF